MDNDDETNGRVMSRREMLGVLGGLGAAALLVGCSDDSDDDVLPAATAAGNGAAPAATTAAAASNAGATALPSCIVIPELTEGPYFVDTLLNRSDIRSDPGGAATRQGVELALTIDVLSVSGGSCAPMSGAMVDIWQCDALGAYSDVMDTAQGSIPEARSGCEACRRLAPMGR